MNTKLAIDARRTVEISEQGFYLAPSGQRVDLRADLDRALSQTQLFRPEDFPDPLAMAPDTTYNTKISVTAETSLEAGRRLAAERDDEALCLNFASAKNPGGGFLGGAKAQEESLARASALYVCLRQCPEYYRFHREQGSAFYSDHMILSPGVPVFADDHGRLLESPYKLAFLTSPAVNAGVVSRQTPERVRLIRPVMKLRLERMLWLARRSGARRLVLGAWGCGVFQCAPEMIAELFAGALTANGSFANRFEEIVFAIYDRSRARSCLAAFEAQFGATMPTAPSRR